LPVVDICLETFFSEDVKYRVQEFPSIQIFFPENHFVLSTYVVVLYIVHFLLATTRSSLQRIESCFETREGIREYFLPALFGDDPFL
jgi:hypothetical protein